MRAATRFAVAAAALALVALGAACAHPARLAAQAQDDLHDLPITEVAPQGDPTQLGAPTIALFISGDGGWAELDKAVSAELAQHGIGVAGLDARSYLRQKHDADDLGRDLARMATTYGALWRATRIVLVGYSRGADILPFGAARLPATIRSRVALIALLGLAPTASFEFHWSDLVRDVTRPSDKPVLPELEQLRDIPTLCVYGTHEKSSLCRDLAQPNVTKLAREGDHHFDRDYHAIGLAIVHALDAH